MTRRLKDLLLPIRSFAVMGIAATAIGGMPTSTSFAQGVWEESDCPAEVACGTDVACGAEIASGVGTSCSAETSCGAEVTCGAEHAFGAKVSGCEGPCQHRSTCGCGSSNWGELLAPEEGLLANARIPHCGLIHGSLETFACGLRKIATLHPHARRVSRSTCGCASCQHHAPAHHKISHSTSCGTCQPTMASGMPTVSAESSSASQYPTLDEHDSAAPPSSSEETPGAKTQRSQPGDTFDQLSDPFEDDSASNVASGRAAIMQTTFANEVSASSHRPTKAAPHHDSDYTDYYRK